MDPPTKKRRALWSLQQLQAAMSAVQGGSMSQREASMRYSIPRRTLVNHLKSGKIEKQIGRRTVLTCEQENDLTLRIKRLASIGFPLTPKLIRHQAFKFCEQHNISNNFNQLTKRAGKDWLKLFLRRHSDIAKRKVQILNPGRAQKLNKHIVEQHFVEYKKIYEKLDIGHHPQRLYNMDEKGCRLTIHNQPMVLAQKGAKRVHMVAPEHAENVTVAACINALGSPIPPMVLFKGKRLKPEFNDNLPAGSLVKMAPKGSMTSELFVDFIHHLGKYKASGKCLLVFDGASCHLDYDIVEAADQHEITLYCLPSNTTHELQPLDKSVNKSFEHHWDEETLLFLYQNPDKKLTKARFNSIFSRVWSKCMTVENIVSGFKATGLYPYNPDAIPYEAYAPSVFTEITSKPENAVSEYIRYSQKCSNAGNLYAVPDEISLGEQGSYRSAQESPIPGPSATNLRRDFQSPNDNSDNSSDSEVIFFEDDNPQSPSLLHQDNMSQLLPDATIKSRLVDYNSTNSDSDFEKSYIPTDPNKSDHIRRSRMYSSESDISKLELDIPPQKTRFKICHNIYSSSDDENLDPLSRHEHTPKKQACTTITDIRQVYEGTSTTSDSDDNIPLSSFETKKNVKSPFQQLIPTPNYAVVKQKPRRKAINYKGRVVTKDLFTEKQKQIEERTMKNKGRVKNKNQRETKQRKPIKTSKKDSSADSWYCHACKTERFADMRQCPVCLRWFHEECVGLSKEDIEFECPMCN